MKPKIHPNYSSNVTVTCSCGNTFVTGSTKDVLRVEICGACHPFYTGQERLIDTARRVEKFQDKMAKIEAAGGIKAKKVKDAVRKTKKEEAAKAAKTKKAEDAK